MCTSAPSAPSFTPPPAPPAPPPPPPPPTPTAKEVRPASGERAGTPSAALAPKRKGRAGLRIDTGISSGMESGLNIPS